ncbi:hypothetical protein H3H39_12745 [Duganella sp. LX47W]|uniref:HTH cro/C1-type domain-containing protein n=2 Tax=Rugamonas apoptosis TaxID=2758570 RepID=A0A7W2IKK8_9BURK|nr:hypothetical protein [Rugamonas apoptosis]
MINAPRHPHKPRTPHHLLDTVIARHDLKNDAALCRALQVSAPRLSKIRRGKLAVNADLVLRIHETFMIPIAELKSLTMQCI